MKLDPKFRYVDHVGIVVRDLHTAIAEFSDVYDLEVELEEEIASFNVRLAFLQCRATDQLTTIQLVQPLGPGPLSDFLDDHGEGLHHVCFAVEDIPLTLGCLQGEGESRIFRGGRGRNACFLANRPSGITIELTEVSD